MKKAFPHEVIFVFIFYFVDAVLLKKKKKKIVKSGKFWKKIYKEKNDHKGVVVHGRGMLHTMN